MLLCLAKKNCPGDAPLVNGKCPEFECAGRLSCSANGDCNSDQSACVCDEGFGRVDCSLDLKGDKIHTAGTTHSQSIRILCYDLRVL